VIVDTSALVAILLNERNAELLASLIRSEGGAQISAPNLVELFVVGESRLGSRSRPLIEDVLASLRIEVAAFTADHARLAADAYRAYGKGTGSRAGLNLADSYSYALAAATGEPLLFVGDDFTHTDIRPALPAS
jgi:ribonuclease VapC